MTGGFDILKTVLSSGGIAEGAMGGKYGSTGKNPSFLVAHRRLPGGRRGGGRGLEIFSK